MTKLTSALAAILVLGSASVALAAPREYAPLVNQPTFSTQAVALHQTAGDSWMDRASKSYDGGGY